MDIARKIIACETIDELTLLESLYVLNDYEQGLVYERKVAIVTRLLEWGLENEQQGLAANLSDSWTPEQRGSFLAEWNDDEPFQMILNEEALQHSSLRLRVRIIPYDLRTRLRTWNFPSITINFTKYLRLQDTLFGVLWKIATARSKSVRFSSNFHQMLASACKI